MKNHTGAYELKSLFKVFKRIAIDEEHITEKDYPFTIELNFSTLGSILEIEPGR